MPAPRTATAPVTPPAARRRVWSFVAVAAITPILAPASGCSIGALIGGMAASAERAGSHTVKPKYSGLVDKTFAVIVAADRSIQGDYPGIIPAVTREVTQRLSDNVGASGVLPADEVLRYQSSHPDWIAKSSDELAHTLGVNRVVYIDLRDFALTDPGNPYIYNGVAAGAVQVFEAESKIPTEPAFSEPVRVQYPDQAGISPNQMPRAAVLTELARRFIERSAWMFYQHDEANIIKY